MKKNKLLIIGLIVTLSLMIIIVALTFFELQRDYFSNTIKNAEGEVLYEISSNATEYQKLIFTELSDVIENEGTPQEYAGSVVKNYVADFYTWSNKKGTYDIGGMQYVYQPEIVNIYNYAKDFFYRDLSYNIQTIGAENLLEVENVEITFSDFNAKIEYNGQMYQSFYVTANWTYVQKEGFDTTGYQTSGEFSLIDRDGKIEIYRYYGE
jgi:hypothetical protein